MLCDQPMRQRSLVATLFLLVVSCGRAPPPPSPECPPPQAVRPCRTDAQCTGGERCLPPLNRECVPSGCGCDETGGYVCTEDCGGRLCRAPDADAGPDDAGQRDAGSDGGLCSTFVPPCSHDYQCRDGERCVRGVGCNPSACGCDPSNGSVVCTADCGGGVCRRADAGVPDAGAGFCRGFVPPCTSSAQCGPGRECRRDPGQCSPSACFCDPQTGSIVCTEDCGGGVCGVPGPDAGVRPDGGVCQGFRAPCSSDPQCLRGERCVRPPNTCLPSSCACGPSGIVCTADCNGKICQVEDAGVSPRDAGVLCLGFVPPCVTNAQCGPGNVCARPPGSCIPSACGCDPSSGAINCTADCGGGVCRPGAPDAGACVGFVAPCSSNAQCGPGTTCQRDANGCTPSACGCDPGSGAIVCTADCGGGVCAPASDAGVTGRDGGTVDAGLCAGFEPPCANDLSCERGRTCRQPLNACVPSACACDPQSGSIVCTADCNGRLCL